ncbi:MAG: NAD(P)/FAD-dependent oxidoreductase, partial [Longimicrobiales bacterium]
MDQPIWFDGVELPKLEPLDADARADACVVGAGIAGLATAYRLARAGLDVVVLERAGVAAGETGNTSAHLASAQDDRFTRLEKRHGRDGAAQAAASHAAAIDLFETIAREETIECGFRRVPGYLFLGPDHDASFLDDELDAATRAGLDVRRLERAPLPAYDTGPCLAFARQAEFH